MKNCIVFSIGLILGGISAYSLGCANKKGKNKTLSNSGKTTCEDRTTCAQCVSDHDSTGRICYWCKKNGFINPDVGDYDPNTCSSDPRCS